MLTETLKGAWVGALRSGHYKQGSEQLRSADNCFCVFGVFLDLYNPRRWVKAPDGIDLFGKPIPRGYFYEWEGGQGSKYILPSDVINLIGKDHCDIIVKMNDGYHLNFNSIADYIEKNVPAAA